MTRDEGREMRHERQGTKKSEIFATFFFLLSSFVIFLLSSVSLAQDAGLEFNLDVNSNTTALPKIFKPSIDLSGRGKHNLDSWPQTLAAPEVLDIWQKEIGFGGVYRIQYNLWEINKSVKNEALNKELLFNYENIIRKISDAGGIVILDIFGTPAGLGKVLDKKSPSLDLNVFKELVKNYIREFSCKKRYNIWYEVWSAPDLDGFFLGKKEEYLALYQAVATGVKELETETKMHIPVGGPAVSWWFQDCDKNTVVTPEKSLIYELIKYCYNYQLPLDFITWHTYSTDPKAEYEITGYNKTSVALIKDWLAYFKFNTNTPLIIDEWNYDSGANFLPARQGMANICASFIPARIKNMYDSGIDYQLYFSLEDFQNNQEHVVRNTGVFWFNSETKEYKGGPKLTYNVFRMLAGLGKNMFILPKANDDFIDMIAAKEEGNVVILVYNYIDLDMAKNYISRNVAILNDAERKALLNFIKSGKLEKIISCQINVDRLGVTKKVRNIFKKAQEINTRANIFNSIKRKININIKNLKGDYLYQWYRIDSSSIPSREFLPLEEKDINAADLYTVSLMVSPYSVNAIILKKKTEVVAAPIAEAPQPPITEPAGEEAPVEVISNQTKSESTVNNKTEDVLKNEEKAIESFVNQTNSVQSQAVNKTAN